MTPEAFVRELDGRVQSALADLGEAAGDQAPGIEVADLLVLALRKELEASEEAALWMTREHDVEVKLALARQCGDEAKHYRLIADRLRELGRDPAAVAPAGPPTPMFAYLEGLQTTVERVAAGQFTREALALVTNDLFIAHCESAGDPVTARLYRDVVQPDERHHHEMGRHLLLRLAATDRDRDLARAASARTLAIAAELQEIARLKRGITCAPGC